MKVKKKTKLYEYQQKAKDQTCEKCGSKRNVTIDHIISIDLLSQLGCIDARYDDEENFQFLCSLCNGQKAHRLDHLNPKTVPLLEKYVAIYKASLSTGTIRQTHQ